MRQPDAPSGEPAMLQLAAEWWRAGAARSSRGAASHGSSERTSPLCMRRLPSSAAPTGAPPSQLPRISSRDGTGQASRAPGRGHQPGGGQAAHAGRPRCHAAGRAEPGCGPGSNYAAPDRLPRGGIRWMDPRCCRSAGCTSCSPAAQRRSRPCWTVWPAAQSGWGRWAQRVQPAASGALSASAAAAASRAALLPAGELPI